MSTITDTPAPVNDRKPTSAVIEIYERMLSPFADADHARWMVVQLNRRGWRAVYCTATRPRWSFGSYEEARRFRADFDELLLNAAEPYIWPVDIYDADEDAVVSDWAGTAAFVDVDTPRDVMGLAL